MIINLDYTKRNPIYEQIVEQIERYVSLGVLSANEKMPSVRSLATSIGINPNTVKKAYDILESKGVIITLSTKGTFVVDKTDSVINNKINENINEINKIIKELEKLGLTKEDILKRLA